MYPNSNPLPDNLKSRTSRIYIDNREFKDDSGKQVKYDRLVVEVIVKGEPFNIEAKIDKKDKAILALADNLEQNSNMIDNQP